MLWVHSDIFVDTVWYLSVAFFPLPFFYKSLFNYRKFGYFVNYRNPENCRETCTQLLWTPPKPMIQLTRTSLNIIANEIYQNHKGTDTDVHTKLIVCGDLTRHFWVQERFYTGLQTSFHIISGQHTRRSSTRVVLQSHLEHILIYLICIQFFC